MTDSVTIHKGFLREGELREKGITTLHRLFYYSGDNDLS